MGYRSEWKLAIGKAENAERKIEDLLTWMKYMVEFGNKDASGFYSEQSTFETIYTSKEEQTEHYITFSDDWTKCYDPWDAVLGKITNKAEELGLDWAYVRIGEETDDVSESSNCGDIRMWTIRSIGDVEVG